MNLRLMALLPLVMASVAFMAAGALLTNCGGGIEYEDGQRRIKVTQPNKPKDGSTITISSDGALTVGTSGEHEPASYTEKATVNGLMIIGGMFGVVAVCLFVFKAKFPLMPSNAPVGCAIASVACFALPTVISKYALYISLGGAAWVAWTIYSYKHNRRLSNDNQTPVKDEEGEQTNDRKETKQ